MNIIIDTIIDEPSWGDHDDISDDYITQIAYSVLKRYGSFQKCNNLEMSVLLTNNKNIQKLNCDFRGNDKPTNVLSFPDHDLHFSQLNETLVLDDERLGDIAIALDVTKQEAEQQGKSFKDHFTHLLVHSILHLIGYDHEDEKEANIMEDLEIQILETMSIKSPYEYGGK